MELPDIPYLDRIINFGLVREPLNWAIVFVFASISLLGFHVVMQAFGAMQSGGQAAFAGPGQINIPDATAQFSAPGVLAGSGASGNLDPFYGYGGSIWTDGTEAKYAEDGWVGNS